jgi:hypothetical protein
MFLVVAGVEWVACRTFTLTSAAWRQTGLTLLLTAAAMLAVRAVRLLRRFP